MYVSRSERQFDDSVKVFAALLRMFSQKTFVQL